MAFAIPLLLTKNRTQQTKLLANSLIQFIVQKNGLTQKRICHTLDSGDLIMEMPRYSIEQLESMISECQRKLAFTHKMLMEDEIAETEHHKLELQAKDLNNEIFRYQNQLRKRYTEEFSKAGQTE